jgi:dTDP-4-amino-4,6-dideoxygalactose transaminase
MALDIKAGDEVITPTYSFFATAGCVSRLGARPVLVDIDPVTFNIDPAQAVAAITPRTKAIMPVHLFGLSADLDPLLEAGRRAGIPIVEDAAQAIGATYHARPAGGSGAFGCFSFFPSKNLGAFGDGGMVLTARDDVAQAVKRLHDHGSQRKYEHVELGYSSRLDELQAALLRVKLARLPGWNESRRRIARCYRERLAGVDLALPVERPGVRHDGASIQNGQVAQRLIFQEGEG